MNKRVLTDEELENWNDLYKYVKKEILQYDDSQAIPRDLVLRLKGLAKGKYMENKTIEDKARYSYKVVLCTFQICKPKILKAVLNKEFDNETFKFNYICKIIENQINDVYIRMQKYENSKKNISENDTMILSHNGSPYKNRDDKEINIRLEELW